MKATNLPRRISAIIWVMDLIDYKIVSPLSSWIMLKRNRLIDEHCRCARCLEREAKGISYACWINESQPSEVPG